MSDTMTEIKDVAAEFAPLAETVVSTVVADTLPSLEHAAGPVADLIPLVESVASTVVADTLPNMSQVASPAAELIPLAESVVSTVVADTMPSLSHVTVSAETLSPLVPLAESALATVEMAVSGNVIGAVVDGLKTAEDVITLSPGVIHVAGQLAQDAAGVTKSATTQAIADITAHVVTGGMLAMIEQEIGSALPTAIKARLGAMLHGFIHAAAHFGLT